MIDFEGIPEYKIFKDFTTMDELCGRDVIDIKYSHEYFNRKDIKYAFQEYLRYFKQNGFDDLCEQYMNILANKSYKKMSSIYAYNNFVLNHPMVVLLYMFIEHKFLTRDLEYNPDRLLIPLGNQIFPKSILKDMNIFEGLIFEDGTLMPVKSNNSHKIGALWVFINNKDLNRIVRYTSDCISPNPIYTSLSEYVKMDDGSIVISEQQAIAMYNIHMLKSTTNFQSILENSSDICIVPKANPEIRLANAKMFEYALGVDRFSYREVLYNLKLKSYLR